MASRDIYSVLAVPNFRWLWVGSLGSSFAMNMQIIARGWFVYDLTSSAMDLAWVTLSFMLPSVLFSLYGGVLADRLPKRRLIVFAQSLNALATLIMAWIIFSGTVVFWDFIWCGFFNGTILALSMPARQAFVPEVIPQPLIFTAMALNTTGWNLSRIVGPALAGLLIAWLAGGDKQSAFGVGVVYVVIAALYLFSALTMLLVDLPGKSSQIQSSGTYNEMREGLAYVFAHPRIFALLLMSIIPFLFGMPLNTLLPAFNQDVLGGHADSLGILVSAMGGGAIVGSMMMATMGDMKRKGLWLLISSLGWAGATAAFGIGSSVAWALLAIALIGLVSAWNMSLNRGLLQHTVDAHMRGRIMSIDMMFHGLMPIGVFPISWVAEAYGVGTALTVSGIAFGAMVVLSYLLSPAVRGMAADAPTSLKAAS
ncbi:MAG: MFS transporter [Proteobacteria bacterium]|nr:MFS transporter [Pseudomonadota bacterium]